MGGGVLEKNPFCGEVWIFSGITQFVYKYVVGQNDSQVKTRFLCLNPYYSHSRPQSPRSFWPVARIESSGWTRFSEHAQSIRFEILNQSDLLDLTEVCESRTSSFGPNQSSRSLPQVRRILCSGDEKELFLDHGSFRLG